MPLAFAISPCPAFGQGSGTPQIPQAAPQPPATLPPPPREGAPNQAPADPSSPLTIPEHTLAPSPPPAISLGDAVRDALAQNPSAQVAYAEIHRAEALMEEARAGSLPVLAGNGTYTHLDSARMSGATLLSPQDALNLNLTLTVPIIMPKQWALWSQASENIDVARASASDVRRTVAVAVARAYLTITAQKRVIDAVTRARDTEEAHFKFAEQRYAGGVGTRLDAVRAGQELQTDAANVEQQWVALAKDREALGVLVAVGGPLDSEDTRLIAPTNEEQALEDAEHRTDVVLADRKRRLADHAVRDDWTDYSPYLVGAGQAFYQTPPTLTVPQEGWEVLLSLSVPLYDAGLRYGQEHERDALRDEARVNTDAAVRQARADVRTAFEEVRHSDAALVASQRAAELADTALKLAQLAYRSGATTNIEVIDAERAARDAETSVAVAEDAARQARLDVLAATGRFP